MCSPTWETHIALILVVGKHISLVICVSREGKRVLLVKCVPGMGNVYSTLYHKQDKEKRKEVLMF